MLPRKASLLPKLRDQYAEFLDHVSLVHLRLLASPTCVGLRYGRSFELPAEAFLACRLQETWNWVAPHPRTPVSAFAYAVGRPIHKAAPPLLQGPFSGNNAQTAGLECSPAIHRLRLWGLALGSASPCADCHGAGILRLTVRGVFTRVSAYSVRHPHFRSLHAKVSTGASSLPERSPTPRCKRIEGQASAGRLIPTILGASTLDE